MRYVLLWGIWAFISGCIIVMMMMGKKQLRTIERLERDNTKLLMQKDSLRKELAIRIDSLTHCAFYVTEIHLNWDSIEHPTQKQ